MKINKDLVDATLMLSFIILVLVGTTESSNTIIKDAIMGVLGVICIIMVVLRGIQLRQAAHENTEEEYN
jgi:hypothetical protein